MSKPWLKLYREESGTFAQLPLVTRAIAKQILLLTDETGRVPCGGREPWEAICFAFGATRGDRRAVKRAVSELLEDGYLVHSGDDLYVRKFGQRQGVEAPVPTTTEQRPDHDRATTVQRPCNEDRPKCAETGDPKTQIKRESKSKRERVDLDHQDRETLSAPVVDMAGVIARLVQDTAMQSAEAWDTLYRRRWQLPPSRPSPWQLKSFAEQVVAAARGPLREWAEKASQDSGRSLYDCVARRTIHAYLQDDRDSLVSNKHPFKWLAESPQLWQEAA